LAQDLQCPDHLEKSRTRPNGLFTREPRDLGGHHRTETHPFKVRFHACAILVCGDALFGMMRVFEVQGEPFFRATRTFRIAKEAEAWLASQ
jgi:hypothetical protein